MASPRLAMRGIGKAFPGVQALADVDFELSGGQVVGLVGENGAGKSTLLKILGGVHQPDRGVIELDGVPCALASPRASRAAGIALIHQELSLCDNLTVSAALFLGGELRRGPFLRRAAMRAETQRWCDRLGLAVDPDTRVAELRPGAQQMLEIARALRTGSRVLVMDEPTSSLSAAEVERLFLVLAELREGGVGIVYVSHRLAEVQRTCDRVVGLRDGRNSGELARDELTAERLVGLMVGRSVARQPRRPHAPGPVVLTVRGLGTSAFPGRRSDLVLRAGEVVALAGLGGSGRSELLRALAGIDRRTAGTVEVAGVGLRSGRVREAIANGLVLVPEDRKQQGLVLSMSAAANLSLPTIGVRGAWLDRGYETTSWTRCRDELGIRAGSGDVAVGTLSGGNQQKVVLGKWLLAGPKVLLLDEPTRGVDVGARAELHRKLHELAGTGVAVLFASSELDEVRALADRVLVLCSGAIVGELPGVAADERSILALLTGVVR
ncbi:MAG: sugar ABC transporter ATP-binding protein [Planctomycetes bacterium]|nr:sugar ABC transporter ATP-binding protein [Planctomycetota bacterium]